MKIHHLRNATFIIESRNQGILIDPMLGQKGTLPSVTRFRHKPQRNPIVSLAHNAEELLQKVTHCLITHSQKLGIKALQHNDHLDSTGIAFLQENNIPVMTHSKDTRFMEDNNLQVLKALDYWQSETVTEWAGGTITAIPAKHGHGWIHRLMANGAGYYLELKDEPSIYISGDTIYTQDVDRVLKDYKPDITVMAAGCASLDIGGPLLMQMNELITFAKNSPKTVIANHLDALNHCSINRLDLKKALEEHQLDTKVIIPEDGESLSFSI